MEELEATWWWWLQRVGCSRKGTRGKIVAVALLDFSLLFGLPLFCTIGSEPSIQHTNTHPHIGFGVLQVATTTPCQEKCKIRCRLENCGQHASTKPALPLETFSCSCWGLRDNNVAYMLSMVVFSWLMLVSILAGLSWHFSMRSCNLKRIRAIKKHRWMHGCWERPREAGLSRLTLESPASLENPKDRRTHSHKSASQAKLSQVGARPSDKSLSHHCVLQQHMIVSSSQTLKIWTRVGFSEDGLKLEAKEHYSRYPIHSENTL